MVWVLLVAERLFHSVSASLDSAGYVFRPQRLVWEERDFEPSPSSYGMNLRCCLKKFMKAKRKVIIDHLIHSNQQLISNGLFSSVSQPRSCNKQEDCVIIYSIYNHGVIIYIELFDSKYF